MCSAPSSDNRARNLRGADGCRHWLERLAYHSTQSRLELEEEIIEPRTLEIITEEGEDTTGVSDGKRASFSDANAKHDMLYSRYHKSKYGCSTCHDVSNPALANLARATASPSDGTTVLPTEVSPA